MAKYHSIALLFLSLSAISCSSSRPGSLVPETPSAAPDYFCTWNIQSYVNSHKGGTTMTRRSINEDNMFGDGPYKNWVGFYPAIRSDLYFVMDDSWDIPLDENTVEDNPYFGTMELSEDRFPSFKGNPATRLKALVDSVKAKGWKGLGGWVCAEEAENVPVVPPEEYWTKRLDDANEAGFSYWKVDWGDKDRDSQWREMLTRIGKEHAPELLIEHAMNTDFIEFSDVYRTYDVENVISQPLTIRRVAELLPYSAKGDAKGIINCEDEPYIAAGLGCAIGIMRHPFAGSYPDGDQDVGFPPVGHNYKKCLDELVRAVRWHRIAEPFGVDENYNASSLILTDYWEFRENETWKKERKPGDIVSESAPATVSRHMALPVVEDTSSTRPYILASTYPNGAVAVSAIGRALGREYVTREVPVTIEGSSWLSPIGIFGSFESVTICYPEAPGSKNPKVYAQDLAGEEPVDITNEVKIDGNCLTITKETINRVGLMNSTEGDLSGPGLVVKVMLSDTQG